MMLLADDWKDYELIDTGNGEKLERWGKYILRRPDPQIIWPIRNENGLWKKADAHYHRSRSGGGSWNLKESFLKGGQYPIMICHFILNPQVLNIQVFFRNRP